MKWEITPEGNLRIYADCMLPLHMVSAIVDMDMERMRRWARLGRIEGAVKAGHHWWVRPCGWRQEDEIIEGNDEAGD